MIDLEAFRNPLKKEEAVKSAGSFKKTSREDEIREKVIALVADTLELDENEISTSSSLIDLGVDSLDAVELVMVIEDEFDMEISDDEAERVRTVGDIIRIVENRR